MPDVFISYAHEDEPFVERLRAALKQRDREVWLDRGTQLGDGIEPADDWRLSATEAIDRSDAFVFVLSAHSLASTPCRGELQHAAEAHKRLIPVCIEEPAEGSDIPEPIRNLSWIMMRPEDDFEAGVRLLIRALDVDIEVVRQHTRILVRAKAWDLAARRTSPLLRGEELRRAEDWLSRAATAGAPPTDLQRDFIVASRRAATRRQRQAIIGSLTVAAIAVALSIFAFVQRSQARQQARLAQSRQLAASAEAELATDPEQSISLAAQGVRIQGTPQAIHALSSALSTSRLRADLLGPSPVEAVAFSPAGGELAVGSDDGAVRMWRLSDARVLWTEGRGDPPASSLSFAHAGDVLAVARSSVLATPQGCSAEVLSASSGAREHTLGPAGSGSCLRFVDFVGSGRLVAVGTDTGTVQFWNVDRGRPLGSPAQVVAATDVLDGLAISQDGRELAVVAGHLVKVINLVNGQTIATIQNASAGVFNPSAVAFSPDGGELLISGEYSAEIYYIGPHTSDELYSQAGETQSAAWAPDGRVLAAGAGFVGLDVWSTGTRLVELLRGGSTQAFSAVAFSAGDLLAGGSRDGSVRLWAADPDAPDHALPVSDSFDFSVGQGAPNVHLAVIGDAHYGVVVVDDQGREVARLSPAGDTPFAVAADGELAFTRGGTLYVWRLPTGQLVRSWKLPLPPAPTPGAPTSLAAVAISADGRTAATVTADGTVTLVSAHGTSVTRIPVGAVSPGLSMSPDGRLLAVTVASGVRILDTNRLAPVRTELGVAATFSMSGDLIAIQRPDLSIAIIRTGDWLVQTTARGEPVQAGALSFSPDDSLVAATGDDGILRTWDSNDGALIATRQVIESGITAQRTPSVPVVLTAGGFAVVGSAVDAAVNAYRVCDQCLNPRGLLAQADARLAEIRPVIAP